MTNGCQFSISISVVWMGHYDVIIFFSIVGMETRLINKKLQVMEKKKNGEINDVFTIGSVGRGSKLVVSKWLSYCKETS